MLNAAEAHTPPALAAFTRPAWGGGLHLSDSAPAAPTDLHVGVTVPDDPALEGQTLRLRATLTVTYPTRITTTRTKLANPQGQEEVDLVVQAGKVAPGQLLDPPDPVADGVDVDVHPDRAYVPRSGAGQELPQRRQQLGPVLVVVGQQRAEQALAERAQHAGGHAGQQELSEATSSLVTTEMAEVPPGPASRSAASRRALPASCSAPGSAVTLSAGPLTPTVSLTPERSDCTTGWAARIVAANRCAAGAEPSGSSPSPGAGTSTMISLPSGATRAPSAAGETSSPARSQRQRSAFGPVTRSVSAVTEATR